MKRRNVIRFAPAYITPSQQPKWECQGQLIPNPMSEHLRRVADLVEQHRDKVRETEADIVLSAVELYGCDIRGLHQQIFPDRTVYLVNGQPLVEVHRPHLKRENLLTPKTWMDNADTPGEWVMSYRLLFKPEIKS